MYAVLAVVHCVVKVVVKNNVSYVTRNRLARAADWCAICVVIGSHRNHIDSDDSQIYSKLSLMSPYVPCG